MDTLSFSLGIAFVVVIVIAIVAVYAFVKVRKIQEHLDNWQRDIEFQNNDIHMRIDKSTEDVYRVLDSRLDKLVDNLKLQKSLK